MVSLLESISSESAPTQHSLITRDGPVEGQLERMRLLLARVGDRVATVPTPDAPVRTQPVNESNRGIGANTAILMDMDDIKDVEDVGRQRAQALLGLF